MLQSRDRLATRGVNEFQASGRSEEGASRTSPALTAPPARSKPAVVGATEAMTSACKGTHFFSKGRDGLSRYYPKEISEVQHFAIRAGTNPGRIAAPGPYSIGR